MYNFIINPKTNRKISVKGKTGRNLIKKYIQFLKKGGASVDKTEETKFNILKNKKTINTKVLISLVSQTKDYLKKKLPVDNLIFTLTKNKTLNDKLVKKYKDFNLKQLKEEIQIMKKFLDNYKIEKTLYNALDSLIPQVKKKGGAEKETHNEKKDCSICFSKLSGDDESMDFFPPTGCAKCGIVFHRECFQRWINSRDKNSCVAPWCDAVIPGYDVYRVDKVAELGVILIVLTLLYLISKVFIRYIEIEGRRWEEEN